MTKSTPPILFIADLHGNPGLFDAAVKEGRRRAGRDDLTVVLAGDLCDNGPSTPALIDRCLEFAATHPGRFLPTLGNHDLACLLTLGLVPASADASPEEARRAWWSRWAGYTNNRAEWTPAQYGAESLEAFERRVPTAHRAFLAGLPWCRRVDGYVFVHAGLKPQPVAPQLADLERRSLADLKLGHQPPQLRDKRLAKVNDPRWGAVVVSGHTKLVGGRDFVASHRLTLHSGACRREGLHAALLPPAAPAEGLSRSTVDLFQLPPRRS